MDMSSRDAGPLACGARAEGHGRGAMPEVLTRHPETVKQVLASGGARCGEGAPQKILTACPPASFCALPGGETCVYDVADVGQMTQISTADLAPFVCAQSSASCSIGAPVDALLLLGGLLVGLALPCGARRRRER